MEYTYIHRRRGELKSAQTRPAQLVGLGLSGGGIRSASFSMGVLQALEANGVLKKVDYLSTVSGGGYIGASLIWFMAALGKAFPFGPSPQPRSEGDGDTPGWTPRMGDYLRPGCGLGNCALLAAMLRGTLVNLLIIVPLLAAAMLLLLRGAALNWFHWLAGLGGVVWCMALLWSALRSRRNQPWPVRRRFSGFIGQGLCGLLALLVFLSLPYAHETLREGWQGGGEHAWLRGLTSGATLGLLIAVVAAWNTRQHDNESRGWRGLALGLGAPVLVYGVALLIFHWTELVAAGNNPAALVWLASLTLSLLLGWRASINSVSKHHYYRDRLREAFLPGDGEPDPDHYPLQQLLANPRGPYPIINTNLVTLTSPNPKLAARLGDNFIFSPAWCGSTATGWVATESYSRGNPFLDLATAMTISGAAVNPNMGVTRFRPLSFLMSLLNIRLGYWTLNPRHLPAPGASAPAPHWRRVIWREMLGLAMDETRPHVHLSDGGHFENLAAYELIRRQCDTVILVDGGADPDWTFADLGNLSEKVRVDFGARIELDLTPLLPDPRQGGTSAKPYAVGKIHYAPTPGQPNGIGTLIYLNTCFPRWNAPVDLVTYRRANPTFPDQSTLDQFFDEAQFEAYRELGYQIGLMTFKNTGLM